MNALIDQKNRRPRVDCCWLLMMGICNLLAAGCTQSTAMPESNAVQAAPAAGRAEARQSARRPSLPVDVQGRLHAATVYIESSYRPLDEARVEGGAKMGGSGFFIADEGLVLTNAHCVASVLEYDVRRGEVARNETRPQDREVFVLDNVVVRTHSGKPQSQVYPAQVLCTRPMPADLALLRIYPDYPVECLELVSTAEFGQLQESQSVWAIGFPQGESLERMLADEPRLARNPHGPDLDFRDGEISSLRRDGSRIKTVSHTCLIEQGNSGGPLVDRDGKVVGVNYYGGFRGFSFAIPMPVAWEAFEATLAARSRQPALQQTAGRRTWYVDAETATIYRFEGFVSSPRPTEGARFQHLQEIAYDALHGGWALDFCRPGDTVHFSPGQHQFSARIPAGIWLRGAGAGRTTLETDGISFQEPGYVEISDLTIAPGQNDYTYVAMVGFGEGAEAFLHDVEFNDQRIQIAGAPHINVGLGIKGGKPDIIACSGKIRVSVDGASAAPRIERLRVGSILIKAGASPALEACQSELGIDTFGVKVMSNADPTVRGCRFFTGVRGGGRKANLQIEGGGGTYEANLFDSDTYAAGPALFLTNADNARFRHNRFVCTHEASLVPVGVGDDFYVAEIAVLKGSSSGISFADNLFRACDVVQSRGGDDYLRTRINGQDNVFIPHGGGR